MYLYNIFWILKYEIKKEIKDNTWLIFDELEAVFKSNPLTMPLFSGTTKYTLLYNCYIIKEYKGAAGLSGTVDPITIINL